MNKKALRETQTLRAGCNKGRAKNFRPAADPLLGGAGRPKFNQLEIVTTFTYKPSLMKIDAACSAACSSSVTKGRHTAIYNVSIFLLLVHTAINDLDLELLELESRSFSGFGLGSESSGVGFDSDLAVAGRDRSLRVKSERQ